MTPTPLSELLQARGLKLVDLAKNAGVDKATVTRWAQKRIPAERVNEIAEITGIPREQLRPDIFAPPAEFQGDAA